MANDYIFLNLDKIKGGSMNPSNAGKQEVGLVKIRFKGIDKEIELTYPILKLTVRYDANGVGEVPAWAAKKLLGPDFGGCYELYEEAPKIVKPERKSKGQEQETTVKDPKEEFLAGIKD